MTTFKPIKIERDNTGVAKNTDLIAAYLAGVNGKATAHTFTSWAEIATVAEDAEKRLERLGIPKNERAGARFDAQSGEKLPNAYKYTARGTVVTLTRRSGGWYLTHARSYDLYTGHNPTATLWLTPEQDAKAIEVLRRAYGIIPPPIAEALAA